jgi:signal transduction histidine kinase
MRRGERAARDGALVAAAAALLALVVFVAVASGPQAGLVLLPALLAYALGARAPRLPGLVLTAAACATVIALDGSPVPALLVTAGPWILGALARTHRGLVRRLAERAAELEAEERRLAALTARRERLRMAADLHHLVGHHLAVIVVQAGAGRLAGGRDDGARADRLADIRRSAADAMADIARLGEVLVPGPGAAPAERLRRLVDAVRSAGARAELRGAPADLPEPAGEQAVRIVQEALTNVVKHAPGARVVVELAREGGHLVVRVEDGGRGGPGSDLAGSGSGLGLAALAAETAALGGRLEAGPTPGGGWRVRAALPLAAAVTPAG